MRIYIVSNPNGVNLHLSLSLDFIIGDGVSNPNGVNLHLVTPSLLFTAIPIVSNPNGVNLHAQFCFTVGTMRSFKPQRGKFTLIARNVRRRQRRFQTPTG